MSQMLILSVLFCELQGIIPSPHSSLFVQKFGNALNMPVIAVVYIHNAYMYIVI